MIRVARIFVLTAFLPGLGAALALIPWWHPLYRAGPPGEAPWPSGLLVLRAPGWGVLAAVVLVALVIRAVGYGAASYAMLRPGADLGQALRYGLRRAAGLSAWTLLAALIVGVAGAVTVLCTGRSALLAAVGALGVGYVVLATALVGPAYLFERGNPLGRSLHLLHGGLGPHPLAASAVFGRGRRVRLLGRAFGRVAWRVGRAGLATIVAVALVAWVGWESDPLTAVLLGAALDVPISMIVFKEILATYLERREAEWGGPLALDG